MKKSEEMLIEKRGTRVQIRAIAELLRTLTDHTAGEEVQEETEIDLRHSFPMTTLIQETNDDYV